MGQLSLDDDNTHESLIKRRANDKKIGGKSKAKSLYNYQNNKALMAELSRSAMIFIKFEINEYSGA